MALFAAKNERSAKVNNLFSTLTSAAFWKEKLSFLKDWKSPFYFFVFTIAIGFLWWLFGLVMNHFTSAFNWDYSSQSIPFAQHFHDVWRHFFATGEFYLYDDVTFLGADNIGANTWFGLFDPFIVAMVIFPRSWVPVLYVFANVGRITLCVYFSRKYLKYREISEGASRMGALAIGFSGYCAFMVGFPTFVAAITFAPLILYGIERVIKEKKFFAISIGVFFMVTGNFLLAISMCIFGVLYAGFRFFVTIKDRKMKDHFIVFGLGVLGFGVGLMLSAWLLLPSYRMSSMTGRTASVGSAYLNYLLGTMKARDFREMFAYLFMEVGENPGRELMGLASFFFPTGGFLTLPMVVANTTGSGYDAWTASIFCYTPFILLFFQALIHSVIQRKISHVLGVLGCLFLVFTTFAYYFFFGFSGNGYGRWLFVIIPSIVNYGCWAFDQRKKGSRLIPLAGSILALAMTIATYFIIILMLKNVQIDNASDRHQFYWFGSYITPEDDFKGLLRVWYLYYQCAWIIFYTVLLLVGYRKKWLPHAFVVLIGIEILAVGNSAYMYVGLWDTKSTYMGGESNLNTALNVAEKIEARGDPYYRVDYDQARNTTNFQYAAGTPGSGSFHSLLNFDAAEFGFINVILANPISYTAYGDTEVVNHSWSGNYKAHRYATDFALGYRYLVRANYPTTGTWIGESVPFGAEELPEASSDRANYRVYRVDERHMPMLGHAIDSDYLYRMNRNENGTKSDYYGYSGINNTSWALHLNHVRTGEIFMHGAILDDNVEIPSEFNIRPNRTLSTANVLDEYGRSVLKAGSGVKFELYRPRSGDGLTPGTSKSYYNKGLGYILSEYQSVSDMTSATSVRLGNDHVMISPTATQYFNDDEGGAYFMISKRTNDQQRQKDGSSFTNQPRVMFLGENGELLGYDSTTFGIVGMMGMFTNWQAGYMATCGFFATGKVAKIGLIWPSVSGDPQNVVPSDYQITVITRSELEAITDKAYEDRLLDVKRIKNGYTFHTNYNAKRIVKLQFAYDLGWNATAIDASGNRQQCQMLRLDGGLQGFIAPSGEMSFELKYFTPGLDKGVLLFVGGIAILGGYALLNFILDIKRTKKQLELSANC